MSGESGAQAEYVRQFPDVNKGKWQVSTTPGVSPLWSPDGRELYYLTADGDGVMSVRYERSGYGRAFQRG